MKRKVSLPVVLSGLSARSGLALIVALTSVLVAATITFGLTRSILIEQREIERRELRSQAELYAQAGFDRAAILLRQNPKLSQIPAWEPKFENDVSTNVIRSTIEKADQSESRIVTITAEISSRSGVSVRSQLRGTITVSPSPADEVTTPSAEASTPLE